MQIAEMVTVSLYLRAIPHAVRTIPHADIAEIGIVFD